MFAITVQMAILIIVLIVGVALISSWARRD
jgi:hypothetical protein